MTITAKEARALFAEANAWVTGVSLYIAEDSRIRTLAQETYGKSLVTHLNAVCVEIFRVVAEDALRELQENEGVIAVWRGRALRAEES